MGAQESHLAQSGAINTRAIKGYHVLRVAESSPASEAGIEPFFDYIVGIGGQAVTEDGDAFSAWLDQSEGKPITLQVYSSRRQEVRNIRTLPSRKWSAEHNQSSLDTQPSLLGLSLRLCSPQSALTNVWHILDIVEGSPAQDAGLVPFGDWVIGYAGGILRGEHDFYEVVEEHEDRPLRLFVYNADYEVTREVVIVPNRAWGSGDGLLGCSIGFGLLHRIPKTTTQTTAPSYLLPTGSITPSDPQADDDEQRLLADLTKTSSMSFSDVPHASEFRDRSTSPSAHRDGRSDSIGQKIFTAQLNNSSGYDSRNHDVRGVITEELEEELVK